MKQKRNAENKLIKARTVERKRVLENKIVEIERKILKSHDNEYNENEKKAINKIEENEKFFYKHAKDQQTVAASGEDVQSLPFGVIFHELPTHSDERGTVFEVFDPRWNWHPDPMIFSWF